MKADPKAIWFGFICGWREVPPLPNYLNLSLGCVSLEDVPYCISLKRSSEQSEGSAACVTELANYHKFLSVQLEPSQALKTDNSQTTVLQGTVKLRRSNRTGQRVAGRL